MRPLRPNRPAAQFGKKLFESEVIPPVVPIPLEGRSEVPLVSLGALGDVVGTCEELGVLGVVGGTDGSGGGSGSCDGGGLGVTLVGWCVLVEVSEVEGSDGEVPPS